jgi:LPS sulfotransferase NodH
MIYLICCTMRSGSTLMCQLLEVVGAGKPGEYFNGRYMMQFGMPERGCGNGNKRKYVDGLIEQYSVNGVFGMKVLFGSVAKEVSSLTLEDIYPERPRYIFLDREDRVMQAISAAKLAQTGVWIDGQVEAGTGKAPVYDRGLISYYVGQLKREVTAWERYFERMQIEPCRVTYEELCADQAGTMRRVLEFLGVSVPEEWTCPETTMRKQADQVSAEWEARYEAGK